MDIELLEIRDFLQALTLFRGVEDDDLNRLTGQIAVRYLRRSSAFPPADEAAPSLYILRQGAVELRNREGTLLQKLAEGDSYSDQCQRESAPADTLSGHCSEDTLLYQLPCAALAPLAQQHPEFRNRLHHNRRERLQHASLEFTPIGVTQNRLMQLSAARLIDRPATTVGPDTTAREAAEVMTREQVSAIVVVEREQLVGILTDKDLRMRLLAVGLSAQTPIRDIMTERLHKLDAETPAFEALLLMARLNIHHLPVLHQGELLGLLTHGDLVRYESANAVYLIEEIRRSHQLPQLIELARQLPEVQRHLVASNISSYHLGWTLAAITDTLTQQLILLAEKQLGATPVPYCWLASGSLARRELTVGSDQDHALLLDDGYDEHKHGDYFRQFSEFVTDGLAQCGFARCPGGVMSSNPQWRKRLTQWRRTFDGWVQTPDPMAMMLASNFFDLRPLAGNLELFEPLQHHALQAARENRIFIAHLAANALHHRPPLGFFRHLLLESGGEHANTLDLKLRGIIPIVDIARLHALAAGLPEVNTRERLQAAARAGGMSVQGAEELQQACEFINTLRLRHQSEQLLAGAAPDNYLDPALLSALDRDHLKDSFAVIRDFQKTLEQRYQSARIG
jgi:CBS domain-containing protein